MKNAGMAGAVALVGIGLITVAVQDSVARPILSSVRSTPRLAPQEDCASTIQEDWFEPVARPLCLEGLRIEVLNALPFIESVDINGDGLTDRMVRAEEGNSYGTSFWFAQAGGWSGAEFLQAISFDGNAGGVRITDISHSVKLAFDPIVNKLGANSFAIVSCLGVADIDGDARVDLIVQLDVLAPESGTTTYWLSNLGSVDPLVADINRDGFVNAQDLGLLIAAWTG